MDALKPSLLLCLALAFAGATRAAPAPGFAENDGDDRAILLRGILPDLRVFIDLKPGEWPRNIPDGELPAAEVREAAALGLGNWASVLPDMRVRFTASADSANLTLRFRDYGGHISGGSSAEAFTPGNWRPAPPDSRAFDAACGAEKPGLLPGGGHCRETSHNIILFQSRGVAFRRVHFLDARMHHAYLAALGDRADSAKRFFRFLPDTRFRGWPPDRSTCVTGAVRKGVLPVWDPVCPTDSDWAALPHYDGFGREFGPYDLAELIQHEFGHALLGGHTGESGCVEFQGGDPDGYRDDSRDPVYRAPAAIRRARPAGSPQARFGYSILFPGNGLDASWNSRGVFPLDAARLAAGAMESDCKTAAGAWKGYRTSYPKSSAWIVLRKPGGETKYVDDWGYAIRLMGWPEAAPGAAVADWFQTGLIPK